MKRPLAALAIAGLTLAACGDDDDPTEAPATTTESMTEDTMTGTTEEMMSEDTMTDASMSEDSMTDG